MQKIIIYLYHATLTIMVNNRYNIECEYLNDDMIKDILNYTR